MWYRIHIAKDMHTPLTCCIGTFHNHYIPSEGLFYSSDTEQLRGGAIVVHVGVELHEVALRERLAPEDLLDPSLQVSPDIFQAK